MCLLRLPLKDTRHPKGASSTVSSSSQVFQTTSKKKSSMSTAKYTPNAVDLNGAIKSQLDKVRNVRSLSLEYRSCCVQTIDKGVHCCFISPSIRVSLSHGVAFVFHVQSLIGHDGWKSHSSSLGPGASQLETSRTTRGQVCQTTTSWSARGGRR